MLRLQLLLAYVVDIVTYAVDVVPVDIFAGDVVLEVDVVTAAAVIATVSFGCCCFCF